MAFYPLPYQVLSILFANFMARYLSLKVYSCSPDQEFFTLHAASNLSLFSRESTTERYHKPIDPSHILISCFPLSVIAISSSVNLSLPRDTFSSALQLKIYIHFSPLSWRLKHTIPLEQYRVKRTYEDHYYAVLSYLLHQFPSVLIFSSIFCSPPFCTSVCPSFNVKNEASELSKTME